MTTLIELSVVTIAYSQLQNNAFIVVLEEKNGDRRIPIVIGGGEAQSIALAIENIKSPRPLTHDLFIEFMQINKCILQNVLIYKFSESIFYARLHFVKENGETFSIDARTSDSIALAIRCHSPIFAVEEVVNAAGIPVEQFNDNVGDDASEDEKSASDTLFSNLPEEELEELLQDAIESEDYEKASLIRDELQKRNEDNPKE